MMYLIYRSDTGDAVSYGSVLADPMPEQFTVRPMTEEETSGVFAGRLMWDPQSISFIPNPGWTAPAES